MKTINLFFVCVMLALAGGCAGQPGASVQPINDQLTISSTAFVVGGGLTAIGYTQPTAQAPAARDIYEVASAVNQAVKTGVTLQDVQSLVNSYLTQWKSPFDAWAGQAVNLVYTDISQQFPATTQPSAGLLNGNAQELAIDLTQGIMNGALPFAGGIPTAALMGAELDRGLRIVVRHYEWKRVGSRGHSGD